MIPMVDLRRQLEGIRNEISEVLNDIIESSHYILGSKVKEFEKKITQYYSVNEAIGVASCTDALHLALRGFGITEGDEVITTPYTFFATVEAILYIKAIPVFVDIDARTFNIDAEKIESKITKKTKAILPVHLFGHPADMEKIMKIAKRYRLKVIEDCAQSFGAMLNSQKVGTFGNAGCFSFYPSKNLGAYGDGGMIILRNIRVAEIIRRLRNHGSKGSYLHERIGFNSRLDEIQAGILLVKLKKIDEYNMMRRKNASLYTGLLSNYVTCPIEKDGSFHVYHQYTILSNHRDKIQQKLKENGISSVVYYPVPLHLQKALRFLGYKKGDFPIAERTSRRALSLPMFPELQVSEIERISEIIKSAL